MRPPPAAEHTGHAPPLDAAVHTWCCSQTKSSVRKHNTAAVSSIHACLVCLVSASRFACTKLPACSLASKRCSMGSITDRNCTKQSQRAKCLWVCCILAALAWCDDRAYRRLILCRVSLPGRSSVCDFHPVSVLHLTVLPWQDAFQSAKRLHRARLLCKHHHQSVGSQSASDGMRAAGHTRTWKQ